MDFLIGSSLFIAVRALAAQAADKANLDNAYTSITVYGVPL